MCKSGFQVGQKVRVYGLMGPLKDYKGVRTIKHISPMHSGGEDMLWFEGGGGAWHPDACAPVIEEFRVSLPLNNKKVQGTIRRSDDLGPCFKSDCGNYTIPISKEEWEAAVSSLNTPPANISIDSKSSQEENL